MSPTLCCLSALGVGTDSFGASAIPSSSLGLNLFSQGQETIHVHVQTHRWNPGLSESPRKIIPDHSPAPSWGEARNLSAGERQLFCVVGGKSFVPVTPDGLFDPTYSIPQITADLCEHRSRLGPWPMSRHWSRPPLQPSPGLCAAFSLEGITKRK